MRARVVVSCSLLVCTFLLAMAQIVPGRESKIVTVPSRDDAGSSQINYTRMLVKLRPEVNCRDLVLKDNEWIQNILVQFGKTNGGSGELSNWSFGLGAISRARNILPMRLRVPI